MTFTVFFTAITTMLVVCHWQDSSFFGMNWYAPASESESGNWYIGSSSSSRRVDSQLRSRLRRKEENPMSGLVSKLLGGCLATIAVSSLFAPMRGFHGSQLTCRYYRYKTARLHQLSLERVSIILAHTVSIRVFDMNPTSNSTYVVSQASHPNSHRPLFKLLLNCARSSEPVSVAPNPFTLSEQLSIQISLLIIIHIVYQGHVILARATFLHAWHLCRGGSNFCTWRPRASRTIG